MEFNLVSACVSGTNSLLYPDSWDKHSIHMHVIVQHFTQATLIQMQAPVCTVP